MLRRPRSLVGAAIALALACAPFSGDRAEAAADDSDSSGGGWEIASIAFEGNDSLSDGALATAIRSRETPSGFSKFMYSTFWGAFGAPPEIFDPVTVDADVDLLADLYTTRGFYNASVAVTHAADTGSHTVAIRFEVVEGRRSYIDSLVWAGIDSLAPELKSKIWGNALIKKGDPYESDVVAREIARVIDLLQNSGYPAARFDYEAGGAFRYTSTNNFDVRLVFVPGGLYRFGEIAVSVEPDRDDITDDLVLRHLDFQTGDVYSRELRVTSERNLSRLDLFEAARVDQQAAPETLSGGSIPMQVMVRPQVRNELSPEVIASDENGALNLGLGVAYTNRNFLGDGRTFNARLQGRTQSLVEVLKGASLKDSAVIGSADLELRILQPYLFTRRLSGFWTTSGGFEKQSLYLLSILRNRIGASLQLSRTAVGFVDWTLERVSPEITVDTDNPDTVYQQLRTEDQPQFNSILGVTWQRDMTGGSLSPWTGYIHTVSAEESGLLPHTFPGLTGGLPYTQYYKLTLLGRWYTDLSAVRTDIAAFKFRTGYQRKYGQSLSSDVDIPLNRRFFSGGSNSVRGWRARKLGAMPQELLEFGGNFLFEASAELRVAHFPNQGKFLGIDLPSVWGVYFVDVGNLWPEVGDFQVRDVAIAAGVGFRYETLFGPFRLDFGIRLYDPGEPEGHQTIFDKKFFGETLSAGVFHLGIGHAF